MTLKSLENKKICVLGLGMENCALLEFLLSKKIDLEITVCDAHKKEHLCDTCKCVKKTADVKWSLGKNYDKNLDAYDVIFRIAGYPLFKSELTKAMIAGVKITSATKFFFDICPTKNIIGVTGTKGKGTTASLIYQILRDAGKQVHFGGNIGIPMFSFFNKIKKTDWVVLELSSFQLEDLHKSPHIAVFTNFFQDHLAAADPNNPNCHKNLKIYWDAKGNIFTHQTKNDVLIAHHSLKEQIKNNRPKAKQIYFHHSEELETPLIGRHNQRNISAAFEVANSINIKEDVIKKSIKKFKGLEHRLEFVRLLRNVRYYNDTFSTTPDTAIIALDTFKPGSIILIAGGSDKGSNFNALAKKIKRCAKVVILLPGKGSTRLKQSLRKENCHAIISVKNMDEAVREAKKIAVQGDVVLLSPACASFGIFKNYKERGELFKKAVYNKP